MQKRIGSNTIESEIDFEQSGSQALNYNVDGTLNYVDLTVGNEVYRQTYGYSADRLSSISEWVKQ